MAELRSNNHTKNYCNGTTPVKMVVGGWCSSVISCRPVSLCSVLFFTVLDPTVGHIMDVLSPFISVLCHSD